ncbi:DUF6261 family protein [Aquimarina muelleri]|uniref:Uncharacterized protein n=1 Tax=Aquimarina muelleri TaxID=279356 RepID=A0A918JWE2_9FLAO|nr:DUF6261 family protein [Aquimarina muelleri]MCX2762402.1 DUF6261 family protein [Aquimarina muelleri]GGX24811.1 hypothetical protein GCM10007384_27320 [Aquimarina muelleri]
MKELLAAPKLENFKNGEFSKYVRTLLELSNEQNLDAMELTSYKNTLVSEYDAFKTVYKKNRGSILTPELAMMDQYRDNGLKLVQRGVKLIADFAKDEKDSKQANMLYKVFSKHGYKIYDMAYNQQGGIMDEIIEEIEETPELRTAIEELNQRKYFDEMKQAHLNFDTVYKSRIKEQQQEQSDLSITELRKTTTKALRELLDWVFIRAKTKGITQFETYIGNLNALTEQYNLSIERRLSNKSDITQELDDDFDPSQGE